MPPKNLSNQTPAHTTDKSTHTQVRQWHRHPCLCNTIYNMHSHNLRGPLKRLYIHWRPRHGSSKLVSLKKSIWQDQGLYSPWTMLSKYLCQESTKRCTINVNLHPYNLLFQINTLSEVWRPSSPALIFLSREENTSNLCQFSCQKSNKMHALF